MRVSLFSNKPFKGRVTIRFISRFNKHGLLLSAAVAAAEASASQSYDIPQVSQYLDFINVMAYDLHGSWDSSVGINAPMYAGPSDQSATERQLNVEASINYWLGQGK